MGKQFTPVLNLMIKNLSGKFDDLSKICDFNKYTMKYLIGVSRTRADKVGEEESEDKELDVSEGQAKEISQQDSDDDEDMGELAAKWVDDDDDDNESDDDDDDDDDENSDDSDKE